MPEAAPRLLTLEPGAPPGFVPVEALTRKDVRAGVFALWTRCPEEAQARLPSPPGRLLGLLVSPGDEPELRLLPSGLYHLTFPRDRLQDAASRTRLLLVLLERIQEEEEEAGRVRLELERAREDSRRHGREYGEFRESLLREIADRRAAELALRQSEERFRTIYDSVSDAILLHHPVTGAVLEGNRRACDLYGWSREELAGLGVQDLVPAEPAWHAEAALRWIREAGETPTMVECRARRRDGELFWVDLSLRRTVISGQEKVLVTARDVTERRAQEEERRLLQAQMQHAQRLESLGVLAGGIAHDFNNLLMAILGNLELALGDLPDAAGIRRPLVEIGRAARSAADLCSQILTYSGRSTLDLRPVNLSDLVTETGRMLEVSVPPRTDLRVHLEPRLPPVEADAGQIQQVVMNLLLNAVEAIGESPGHIAVTTALVQCSRADLAEALLGDSCAEGAYVLLQVEDTGQGMPPETAARIFEPFFSTKVHGRGLGLAAVLGIVRGHGGAVRVRSWPGQGTTIQVLLPALPEEAPEPPEAPPEDSGEWEAAGTVLVVDDEEFLRTLLEETLGRMGFRVLMARGGREALRLFQEAQGAVDLVLLDYRMPGMDGLETCRALRALDAEVPVLMMSGYNEPGLPPGLAEQRVAGFLQKPYRARDLKERIRRILGSRVET